MPDTAFAAHVSADKIQTVKDHLEGTAGLAEKFASGFGAGDQGRLAGLLHDVGKYSKAFQNRILGGGPKVDHSTAGAQEAIRLGQTPAAFAIAGHHTGLPDGGHPQDPDQEATLFGRAKRSVDPYTDWKNEITLPNAPVPAWAMADSVTSAFYTRMLYSCLVDADFLDTEAFMNGGQPRQMSAKSIQDLLPLVRGKAMAYLSARASSLVSQKRNVVLENAILAGQTNSRGIYSLTVPTGGGKTFASLSFGMEHAAAQGMDRLIYVLPYMSIIDQTVKVFSDILGEENVLAHYSSAEYETKDYEDMTDAEREHLLATENWDCPVVVTTAVQFFESLYSNKSSRCRKLHNIANSVVIFDEAQTMPRSYLYPCVSAIGQLVSHYNVTAVLCTATQPALAPLFEKAAPGLEIKEIVQDTGSLYEALKRTNSRDNGYMSKENLWQEFSGLDQVLCIVNMRSAAQEIYGNLPKDGSYCLTTLLCAADRKRQIEEIRERLRKGLPCRVVSTSLIEAGVDVDFPTVYRERAGLDSLLQAAGRCNREGKRSAENSIVYTFDLSDSYTPSSLLPEVGALRYTQRHHRDVDSIDAIHCYFEELFYDVMSESALDQNEIIPAFEKGISGCLFPFEQVAERFHIIEDTTVPVYLPIGDGEELCNRLRSGECNRALYRRLGLYSTNCRQREYNALLAAGALEVLDSGDVILKKTEYYDEYTGLGIAPKGPARISASVA